MIVQPCSLAIVPVPFIPSSTDVPVFLPTIPPSSLPPRSKRNIPVTLPTTPLPSLPPRSKGDSLLLPSLPPQSKGVPLPSLPSRSKGDPLPSLPSSPPKNKGEKPIPSSPKGDQLDLPPGNEYNNDNDNIRRLN